MKVKPLGSLDWHQFVHPGNRVFIGSGAAVPNGLIRSMLEQAEDFKDVELVHMHTFGEMPWINERFDGAIRTNTFFLRPAIVEAVARGMADYTPVPIFDIPWLFKQGDLPIDVALVQVTPPDAKGFVSLGVSVDIVWAAVKSAKRVIAQINPRMPRSSGPARLPLSRFSALVEATEDLPIAPAAKVDERQQRIAAYTAQLIDDGACLQVSMGNTPQHVLSALKEHRRLGIHTGLITDGFVDLIKEGAVDNSLKRISRGISIASHAFGSNELYDFIDKNKELELHPSEWVNDPARISSNPKVVAINGAREVDITGQVVRDSRGHHFYGGIGAIQDFVRGAGHSRGGRPIVTLTSTDDETKQSRIVATLSAGSGVCTSRGDVHYVVTEYGVASLHGRSIRERVLALSEIAHPDFRENLLAQARKRGMIPAFYTMPSTSPLEGEVESRNVKFGGNEMLFRPLHPSDMRSLQQFFYSHDTETIRLRFGHVKDRMNAQGAYKLTSIDQRKDLALGLFKRIAGRTEIRGIGRFYLDPGGESAEVAFVVHESLRRLGIARFLLFELARIAQQRGVKHFWASVLKQNQSMAGLFLSCGARRERISGDESDEFYMEVDALVRELAMPRKKPQKAIKTAASKGSREKKLFKHKLGLIADAQFKKHDTGPGHPESPRRMEAIEAMLANLKSKGKRLKFAPAKVEDILLVHDAQYHDFVRIDVDSLAEDLRTGDTPICPDSYDVAMAAAGAAIAAVDSVMKGECQRVFCATRPPGHHATPDRGMGFCIFNNIAIAARHALDRHGLERVAIIDWDVHHGNGTQDAFLTDSRVLFFSTHESGIYPHTGAPVDQENIINVEISHGGGDKEMFEVWDTLLEPALSKHCPQMILISAGFDARVGDPIGGLEVSDKGFAELTRRAMAFADRWSEGRLVSILEGGYEPPDLALAVKAHLQALAR